MEPSESERYRILKDIEASLEVKSSKVHEGLEQVISPDGYYKFYEGRLVVKFIESLGWNEAKDLWINWDKIGAKVYSLARGLGREPFTFLLICKTLVPEAAVWLNYVCSTYAPSLKGEILVLDMSSRLTYGNYQIGRVTRFLLLMGSRHTITLYNPEKGSLKYKIYSEEKKRWMTTKTAPESFEAEKVISDSRISSLKLSPRPYTFVLLPLSITSFISFWTSLYYFSTNSVLAALSFIVCISSFLIILFVNEVQDYYLRTRMPQLIQW